MVDFGRSATRSPTLKTCFFLVVIAVIDVVLHHLSEVIVRHVFKEVPLWVGVAIPNERKSRGLLLEFDSESVFFTDFKHGQ